MSLTIQVDYSFDSNNFFDEVAHPERRTALESVVQSIADRLNNSLGAITPGTVYNAGTEFEFRDSWRQTFAHPGNGLTVTLPDSPPLDSTTNGPGEVGNTIPADTLIVYAGGYDLAGETLGEGGPGGFAFDGVSSFGDSITGRAPIAWGGSITFDSETNWYFGLDSSGLDGSEADFLSVAYHEMFHLLGFGTADLFGELVTPNGGPSGEPTFGGPRSREVLHMAGYTGDPLLYFDAAHWEDNTQYVFGLETAMDPTIVFGERKLPTPLDWAAMQDIGWEVGNDPLTTYIVTNTNDSGANSLRDAITWANGLDPELGVATILFNIPDTDPGFVDTDFFMGGDLDADAYVINLDSALPILTRDRVIIDGNSQTLFGGNSNDLGPEVVLNGAGTDNGNPLVNESIGLNIHSSFNVVQGLVIQGFDGNGISLFGGYQNTVRGNYIGTDATGTQSVSNAGFGILILASNANTIGGEDDADRNVISGNVGQAGISLQNGSSESTADYNVIRNNYIGTDASGQEILSNGSGIFAVNAAQNTFDGNLISGNFGPGVELYQAGAYGNQFTNNIIGLNISGDTALPNGDGIVLVGASSNIIGSLFNNLDHPLQGKNIISGNIGDGIRIEANTNPFDTNEPSYNSIEHNYIGTDIYGLGGQGNGGNGIHLLNAPNNYVGLVFSEFGVPFNVISGNQGYGILISGEDADGNSVSGNYIGTSVTGSFDIANLLGGVLIEDGADYNLIGGYNNVEIQRAGNLISGNGIEGDSSYGDGVHITGAGTTGNQVSRNLIGTDVSGLYALPNHRHGVLVSFGATDSYIGGTLGIEGNVISGNSGDGVVLTDEGTSNNVVFGNIIGLDKDGDLPVANAFSGVSIFSGASNNTIGGDRDYHGNVISGILGDGLVIAGLDANENLVQGNRIGTDITGAVDRGNEGAGISIYNGASVNTIGETLAGYGAYGNIISGNAGAGINISGYTDYLDGILLTSANRVAGNIIGLDITGTQDLGNDGDGIAIFGGATNTTIGNNGGGFYTGYERNIISGNAGAGIAISGFDNDGFPFETANNRVAGNYIGTDITGNTAIGNDLDGVVLFNFAWQNQIGGPDDVDRNIISGNAVNGVRIESQSHGNTIRNNIIGLGADEFTPLGNGLNGIDIYGDSDNNTIGGPGENAGNIIASNRLHGIRVADSTTNNTLIEGNIIGLGPDGELLRGNGLDDLDGFDGDGIQIAGADGGYILNNIVSGNLGDGIDLAGPHFSVRGNIIGLDSDGNVPVGNAFDGVRMTFAESHDNSIGGVGDSDRNIISANGGAGVRIDFGAANNAVNGNYIGTDATGAAITDGGFLFYGNLNEGVSISDASNNSIGGLRGNVIAGNGAAGVAIIDQQGGDRSELEASGNVIQRNFIGTDATGTLNLGNNREGIYISASGNTIGNGFGTGEDPNAGNIIAFNGLAFPAENLPGIGISDFFSGGSTGNAIRQNRIYQNAGLGIDLTTGTFSYDGVTANDLGAPPDTDTGPNDLQNFPVLSAAVVGQAARVIGSLNSTPNTTFRLDFYANPSTDSAEGRRWIGSQDVFTDANGQVSFDRVFVGSPLNANEYVTATATSGQTTVFVTLEATGENGQSTSEFSAPVLAETREIFVSIANDPSVTESDINIENLQFVVSLSEPTTNPITVLVNTSNGTASAGSDYNAVTNLLLTFNPGAGENQTVFVQVLPDNTPESDETVNLALSSPTNATIGDGASVGTILNDDAAVGPDVSISDAVAVVEGNSASFTISLSAPAAGDVTVFYSTANGTALAGSDYTAQSSSVTFTAGQTTKTVLITTLDDATDEDAQTFFVNLTSATGGNIIDSQGVGTINDNDNAPGLSINDASVTEGTGGTTNLVFTVSLGLASDKTVTVDFATSNFTATAGSDFTAQNNTLTFLPGQTSKTITIAVNPDDLDETNEQFFVTLSNAVNGSITDNSGTGTINDDDDRAFSINDVSVTEGTGGTTNLVFTVSLTNATTFTNATVDFATSGSTATSGTDFTAQNNTLTFLPGQTSKTITIAVNPDDLDETNEQFFVTLSNGVNGSITDGSGTGTINDDDDRAFSINDVSVTEGTGGTTNLVFTVSLTNATTFTNATVDFATSGSTATSGSDFTAQNNTLTFLPGQTSKTITIAVNPDDLDETNEQFFVTLSNAVNGSITDNSGTGTINDDDDRAFSINDVSVTEGTGGTTNLVFTVSLTNATTFTNATVDFATSGSTATSGTDFTAQNNTLTFLPGQTSKTVIIAVNPDDLDETNEQFFVTLSNAVNGSITDNSGTGTINDDDDRAFSINDAQIVEGDSGTTNLVFTVSLTSPTSFTNAAVDFATSNFTAIAGSDYTAQSGTLTFTPGQTSQTISVPILGDLAVENNEQFFVGLSNVVNGSIGDSSGTGAILNDDPKVNISSPTLVEGTGGVNNLVFVVSITAQPTSNVSVRFDTADGTATAGSDYTAVVNQVITFTPGGATSFNVSVPVNTDNLVEADETLRGLLSNLSGPAFFGSDSGTGTLLNDDLPVASIGNASLVEGDAGSQLLAFTVSLDQNPLAPVTVTVNTSDVSAFAGLDYTAVSNLQLTFLPGASLSQTVNVPILGDLIDEPNETFAISLSGISGAAAGVTSATGTIEDNDPTPTVSISDAQVLEGNPGQTRKLVFNVSLTNPSSQAITINYSTADGSAVAGSDFIAASGSLTIPAGQTSGVIEVDVLEDYAIESDEDFQLNLTLVTTANATLGDASGQGVILNDDNRSVSIANAVVSEGNPGDTRQLTFNVTLTEAINEVVTVNVALTGGTATQGVDYTTPLTSVTIPANQTSASFVIDVIEDLVVESNETVLVSLTSVVGGNASIDDGSALGAINNDDATVVSISPTAAFANEGDSGTTAFVYTVSLTNPSDSAVSVQVATSDGTAAAGSDYAANTQTLTFNPGQTSQNFTVLVNGDTDIEANETFNVSLSNLTGTGASLGTAAATGAILNDDGVATPSVFISDVSLSEGDSGTTLYEFTLSLSSPSASPVTLDAATADGTALAGSDYTANNASFTFDPGQTQKTFTVSVNGDSTVESAESFFVNLTNVVGANVADGQGQGTIGNDDATALSIDDVSVLEGNAGQTGLVFNLSLTNPSDSTITVLVNTADGSATTADNDYDPLVNQLVTFLPGETSATVTVDVNGDTAFEADETLLVNLSDIAGNAASIADNQGQGTITNDDEEDVELPAVSIGDLSQDEGNAGTSLFTFNVTLSEPSDQTVTVLVSTSGGTATAGSDYDALTSQLVTFEPGETSKPVSVTVYGDTTVEGNETFFVTLSDAVNAVIDDGQGQGTIGNDDATSLAIASADVLEGNSGATALNFNVTLTNPSDSTITVLVNTADGSATTADNDYAPLSGYLVTFLPGQTQQSLSVNVNGDTKVEADQSFTVTLSGATGTGVSIGTAQATGGILNDDATAVSIANASTTEGNSGTKPLNFSVSLSNPSDFPVTVKLTTVAGTAGDGSDYQGVAGQTITFNPGETLKLVPVNLLGDTNTEADEIFGVNLSDVTGAAASIAQGSATGTILNDDIITTPLAIQSVSVNGGVAQRSNLETIAIKFNQAVNLADLIANGAIVDAVKLFNTTANTQVALTVSRYTYNAGTNTLTIDVTTDGFNGSRKTMLSDARYEFRLDPAVIHAATNTGNRLVDDDGTADGLRRVKFHRLEGDFNGDAAVTAADRAILNSKLLKKSNQVGYDYAVDLNGDGVINALDSALLAKMIGRTV